MRWKAMTDLEWCLLPMVIGATCAAALMLASALTGWPEIFAPRP